jgi:ribose transport system substrate-binding protein
MNHSRLTRISSLILAILIAISGCNRSKEKEIAVIPKGTAHVFWQSVHAGALAAGQEFHLDILWDGTPQETDYSRQIEIVDSMIARHVDGIAVAAGDRNALNSSLDRAARENIPVTVFDSGVDSNNYMTFVATNNYAAGQMGARKLAELIHQRGSVAMVMHAPGSASTMDRERGFEDVVNQEFPNIHIVARQFSMSDRAKAMAAAENILTAHTDLDGLFASSEPSSVGAAQAIKSRGLSGKVKYVAFDSSEGLIDDLKGGTIDALVAQDPFRIGFEAVKTLADKLAGKTPPKREDLSARVITKADLEKPEIHALLYPDLKKYLK